MTTTTRPLSLLDRLRLQKGSHDRPRPDAVIPEACLMEAVSWMAGEPWSAHPACVSQVLGTYGRRLNDLLPDDRRQELVPMVPRLIGTAGDGQDEARSYLALDWLVRTYTPAWLDLAGLGTEATALRDLGRIADMVSAERAGPVVGEARDRAAAAGAAAGAWAAAGAAWAAGAVWAAGAAQAAAGEQLQPTVDQLQTSAIALMDAMISPREVAP